MTLYLALSLATHVILDSQFPSSINGDNKTLQNKTLITETPVINRREEEEIGRVNEIMNIKKIVGEANAQ